jgi:hypothetical protein
MILESFFNILLIMGQILQLVQIIQWLTIVLDGFRMQFDPIAYLNS